MKNSILAKIKSLPPLDNTVAKIQYICNDKNSSLSDLSNVIQEDPMLTANILKAANSPLYGFSREVKNINHAVSLFGMATIRGFALSSAIRQNIKIDLSPYGITNDDFLNISSLQSALMINWYKKVDPQMLDILSPASFLMEIGKIILAHEIISNNKKDAFLSGVKSISTTSELARLEYEFTDFTNEEITAGVFDQWNLEIELVEAIKYSEMPNKAPEHIQPYAKALHVVKNAINIFERLSENSMQNAVAYAKKYNMNCDLFIEVASRVRD